ncbi:MAG: hypothetical protein P1T08_18790 [Acidimicrobiia bacterium]|nr:hypothetical protein [Acidimicrobiia bacterium]
MKLLKRWPALLIALALVLAACGADEGSDTTTSTAPADEPVVTATTASTEPGDEPATTTTSTTSPDEAMEAEVAAFYSDNDIHLMSGGGVGGGAYTYTELVGRYIGQYIPGNPEVIVEARPGAGTMINAIALFNTDEKDGTFFGTTHANMMLAEATGIEEAKFSFLEFGVIGAVDSAYLACGALESSGITDIQQLIDGGETLLVGASQPGSGNHDTPAALNAAIGSHFEIISGYDSGGGPILLAMERGEVDGGCGTASTFEVAFRDLMEDGSMKILVTIGDTPEGNPFLEGVPHAEDLALSEDDLALLKVVAAPAAVAWPFVMPPGVPPERLAAVQKAFAMTLQDPDFLADAAQANLAINYQSPEAVLSVFCRHRVNTDPLSPLEF